MKDKYSSRKAIRSLRLGVVPTDHILDLTVGVSSLKPILDKEIQSDNKKHQSLIINGEWGAGKSTILCYIREYALKNNFVVSSVSLNGRSTPINYPQRFYHKIVNHLSIPGEANIGIIPFLNRLTDDSVQLQKLQKWAMANYYRSSLAKAIHHYLISKDEGSERVLIGGDLYWSSKKLQALERINDLGDVIKFIGYHGLLIQFDELESIIQLWSIASRKGAYRNLKYLMQKNDLWIIFASTEKLKSILNMDLVSQKLTEEEISFIKDYLKLESFDCPRITPSLAKDIIKRINSMYTSIYKIDQDNDIESLILEKWDKIVFKDPRRLIRIIVDNLDVRRADV